LIGIISIVDDQALRQAASLLWENWQAETTLNEIPDSIRPRTREDGYRIGEKIAELSGQAVVGWKIAATSVAGQKHINVDGPLGGRLLSGRLLSPNGSVRLGKNIMRVAEAEFAFKFAKPLPRRADPYDQSEVIDAVASLHISIEIPDSRFRDFTIVGAPSLIADTACASWLMIGPEVHGPWRNIDLSEHAIYVHLNHQKVAEGRGNAALGDPRIALTWLVNEVCHYADGIKANDVVTTGTCVVPVSIKPSDRLLVDYGTLGSISIDIL
jgi:2-keto-4-pentenoate hydratase